MRAARLACLLLLAPAWCAAAPPDAAGAGPQVSACAGPSAVWRSKDAAFVIQAGAGPAVLQRRALSIGPGGAAGIGAGVLWDAAALLAGGPSTAPSPAPEARNIHTFSGEATLPFSWVGLPADLRAMLDGDGQGEARTAFLRGDRSGELGQPGGVFRKRTGVLGDIVHSAPLIVGAPSAAVIGEGHDIFREQAGARRMAVYVGASDGMLHAFGASDGAELFAYVPRTLVAALGESSDPAFRPRPYVDGSPGQGDALIGARWRTVLASGMGMGARGVFALDISDPMAFVQGMGALWEFTEKDDPAIGYVQGAPQIAKLNTAARGRPPAYRYFVIVPSAVNGVAAGGNGALFLLALDKPAAQRWRAGVNYFKIATSGADAQQANGLSPPGLVTAADGSASLAYAGDLQGRLWRFDLSAMTAQRLFTARDAGGRAQPIAGAPRAVFAPGGGYLVLFGTGKLTEPADLLPASSTPQSLYGILDRLEVPAVAVRSRAQLAERTLSGGDGYSTMGDPIDYFASSAKRGWFIDLANGGVDGERSAGTPSVIGSAIVFDTVLPGADLCAPAAHREYVLDALSGMALGADGTVRPDAVTAKLVPAASPLPPLLLETGVATAARSATGMATATRTFTLIQAGPNGGPAASTSIKVSFPAMRLGWREVANWQELHDAANR